MNSKKWIKIFVVLSFIGILFVGGVNYVVDPFNIFHTKVLKNQFQQNERFLKIEYLEKNHNKFNGYMFGSSRIGTTPPKYIEKYIPNSKFYNLTVSGANIYDHKKHIEFIVNNYQIKTIYLQIDLSNMSEYERNDSDYLRKLHPLVNNQSIKKYYFDYLTGFFPFNIKGKIMNNINLKDKVVYSLEKGTWARPLKDKRLLQDCKAFVNSEPSFNKKNKRTIKYTKKNQNINALKYIKNLAKEKNIKLIVFITPHNKNMMDTFIIKDYLTFLYDISVITNFYDFSGYNSITINNCNYHEWSHYISIVGKLIAARIFNDKSVDIPKDFGVLVTKQNIDQHLKNLKEQIKNYDLNKSF